MATEKKFIKEHIKLSQVEEFLEKEFSRAGYSHVDIARTPVATRVTVWVQKPGIVIGRGGKTIDALTETLKTKFGMQNPALDVQEVENPYLDARIVGQQIVSSIERGLNYKRVVQFMMQKVMDSGAVGVAIRIGGKVGGEMSRIEKFSSGYLTYAGEPAEKLGKSYSTAMVKLGAIGIQVRILKEMPEEMQAAERMSSQLAMQAKTAEKEQAARKAKEAEEPAPEAAEPSAEPAAEKIEETEEAKEEGE